MGRRKSKSTPAEQDKISKSPDVILFPSLGPPCLTATVTRSGAESNSGQGGKLYLASEAFLHAQLAPGQVVLVALSDSTELQTEDTFPYAEAVKSAPQPINIWNELSRNGLNSWKADSTIECKESLSGSFSQLSLAPVPVQEEELNPQSQPFLQISGAQSDAGPQASMQSQVDKGKGLDLGSYALVSSIWPAKLPKGYATISDGLLNSLGGEHAIGRSILLYKVLAKKTSKAYSLLQLAGSSLLEGRLVMDGNPVALPFMGKQLYFRAELPAQRTDVCNYICMTKKAGLELLLPEDSSQHWTNSKGDTSKAELAAGWAAETIGGGREGPAAQAAFRAAESGLNALAGEGLEALGGLKHQIQTLEKLVLHPIMAPDMYLKYGIQTPRGVLLWGPPGTGKTRLAAAMARRAGVPFFVVNGPDVVSSYYGYSEMGVRGIFAAAKAAAPAIIFLDEVDSIATAREGGFSSSGTGHASSSSASGASVRLVTSLLTEMADPEMEGVIVIAATNRPDALDPALRRPGRFDRELEVGVPTPLDRLDILKVRMAAIKYNLTDKEVMMLAELAHGFVGADLSLLVREASLTALRRCLRHEMLDPADMWVSLEDFQAARLRVGPSAMREISLEVPNVSWEDVGGLDEVKQRLKESVLWPQDRAADLITMGISAPRGILLYGPPGCSKTLLARAVAAEAKLNFLAVKGPELFSKYVGESEKAVAKVFAKARQNSPAIVFFDEIDGLAGKRSDGDEAAGMHNRVLSTLLTEMDGLQERSNVVIIAATNRPDKLDNALLRAGRFDRLLYIPPPGESAREAILVVHTRKTPLSGDVDLKELAKDMQGYTGADITAVVREAGLAALTESLESQAVAARHFSQALQVVQPSGLLTEEAEIVYKSFRRGIQTAQYTHFQESRGESTLQT